MVRTLQALVIFGAIVLLFGCFFFGYLVGQGEFMEEQEKLEKFIGDMEAKARSLLGFKTKVEPPLVTDSFKDLHLQFYEEKGISGKNEREGHGHDKDAKRFFLEIKVTNPNIKGIIQEELKDSGLAIKTEGMAGASPKIIRIGPISKEGDAKRIKERLFNRLKDQEIKIISEG